MNKNEYILKKIPIIVDAREIVFKGEIEKILKKKLTSEVFSQARSNSKKVNVYKIVYTSNNHSVVGFLIEPKKKGKFPCIVYNRGGSRDFGAIKMGYLFTGLAKFANWGYIIIASQYSGNSGSEGRDEMGGSDIYDVLNLYKILKKYRRVDNSRIGMYGHSRGGLMTYLALTKVKWIKAAIAGAAPADEVSAPRFRPGWNQHQKDMYGGSLKEKKKRSAVYWAHKFSKKTPVLLLHGSSDWRVNPLDSIRLAEKLYKYQIPFKLVIFEGGDHGLSEHEDEEERQIKGWFNKYLKNNGKINLQPHGK